jgi:hypothetical protein
VVWPWVAGGVELPVWRRRRVEDAAEERRSRGRKKMDGGGGHALALSRDLSCNRQPFLKPVSHGIIIFLKVIQLKFLKL